LTGSTTIDWNSINSTTTFTAGLFFLQLGKSFLHQTCHQYIERSKLSSFFCFFRRRLGTWCFAEKRKKTLRSHSPDKYCRSQSPTPVLGFTLKNNHALRHFLTCWQLIRMCRYWHFGSPASGSLFVRSLALFVEKFLSLIDVRY
jgi:hypothetical protein